MKSLLPSPGISTVVQKPAALRGSGLFCLLRRAFDGVKFQRVSEGEQRNLLEKTTSETTSGVSGSALMLPYVACGVIAL